MDKISVDRANRVVYVFGSVGYIGSMDLKTSEESISSKYHDEAHSRSLFVIW